MNLILRFAMRRPVQLSVPDMGLTPREWAEAVFTATNVPPTSRYGVPGALEVAAALERVGIEPGPSGGRFGVSDRLEVGGQTLTCVAVDNRGVDAWGLGTATFTEPQPLPSPLGPPMHVSAATPPPDAVAYVEDERDRLWTGRGAGEWRCLTDPAGRTAPLMWAGVWREHGPLTPLVPVRLVDAPGQWPEGAASVRAGGPGWSAPGAAGRCAGC